MTSGLETQRVYPEEEKISNGVDKSGRKGRIKKDKWGNVRCKQANVCTILKNL